MFCLAKEANQELLNPVALSFRKEEVRYFGNGKIPFRAEKETMNISIIVAADEKGAIGFHGNIPWHLPADFKRFKELTMGHFVIVGQKTFESMGKPLPGRKTIVVSNVQDYRAEGCSVAHSFEEAMAFTGGADEVFVIGGGQIYRLAMPVAETIYLTRVHGVFEGDVFFPEIDENEWDIVDSEFHAKDEKNPVDFTYLTYRREK